MNPEQLEVDLASLSLHPKEENGQYNSAADGNLVPLRTRAELCVRHRKIEIFVCEILTRHASEILTVLKNALPEQSDWPSIHHLRRFAKPGSLPEPLISPIGSPLSTISSSPSVGSPELLPTIPDSPVLGSPLLSPVASPPQDTIIPVPTLSDVRIRDRRRKRRRRRPNELLWVLLCPTEMISLDDLRKTLSGCNAFDSKYPPEIRRLRVPSAPPLTQEEANTWGQKYWPMIFNNSNPYGPHPGMISHIQPSLEADVAGFIALARQVALEGQHEHLGEQVGCLVVQRSSTGTDIVAVARDGRWCGSQPMPHSHDKSGPGNIAAHAVMRAIGLVARKRRKEKVNGSRDMSDAATNEAVFTHYPMTPLEKEYDAIDNLVPNGYLCLNLEFYMTHEPCAMCSMALVHSRIGRLIFAKRMPLTGAICSERASVLEGDIGDGRNVSTVLATERANAARRNGCSSDESDDEDDTISELDMGEQLGGLGYGMFWRDDLNWRFPVWQWQEAQDEQGQFMAYEEYARDGVADEIHV